MPGRRWGLAAACLTVSRVGLHRPTGRCQSPRLPPSLHRLLRGGCCCCRRCHARPIMAGEASVVVVAACDAVTYLGLCCCCYHVLAPGGHSMVPGSGSGEEICIDEDAGAPCAAGACAAPGCLLKSDRSVAGIWGWGGGWLPGYLAVEYGMVPGGSGQAHTRAQGRCAHGAKVQARGTVLLFQGKDDDWR